MSDKALQVAPQSARLKNGLILSVFTGIGMLDSGFQKSGYCVVSAGDIIWNKDIRDFKNIPAQVFEGIIAGPPCQDFSKARRSPPTGYGLEMLSQFKRIVLEAEPSWFLMENVPTVPDLVIEGYNIQRFELSPPHVGAAQSRNRHFQFGSKLGIVLDIKRDAAAATVQSCCTASEGKRVNRRTFKDFCQLQGFENEVSLPDFTKAGRYKLIGNGVHLAVSRAVAKAIFEATTSDQPTTIYNANLCGCGCGRILTGKQKTATSNCRKRRWLKQHK